MGNISTVGVIGSGIMGSGLAEVAARAGYDVVVRSRTQAGADAVLVKPPAYYRGRMSPEAIRTFFVAVADASPIPVVLYHVPKFVPVDVVPELAGELMRHGNIVGIKDSTGNVMQLGEFLGRVEPDFSVLVGTASALFGALTLGCVGAVLALANVAPDQCVEIFNLVRAGDT